tara:strand:+ start:65 stop:343 length:279 start_codon:yes stop_codon:yes gene_type:complete
MNLIEAKMTFFDKIFTKLSGRKLTYEVGQRLYSNKKRKGLVLEREIYVNDIKHFRVRIEGMKVKKAVILSEVALLEDHYKSVEDISEKEILF